MTGRWERFYNRIERSPAMQAIRDGMLMAVPAIMIGSIALVLLSLPVAGYQSFLKGLLGGAVVKLLTVIQESTLGLISLILLLTISFSYERQRTQSPGLAPIVSLCAYIAFVHDGALSFDIFQSNWLFYALVTALLASWSFVALRSLFSAWRSYADGSDALFNSVIAAVFPGAAVVAGFALLNALLSALLGGVSLQHFLGHALHAGFSRLGRAPLSGFLFILFLHGMWFFGIHGGNVLDSVAKDIFGSGLTINVQLLAQGLPPTEIFSKAFFDTFVLFGGCGALLCLVVALLIGERRRNLRSLTKVAAVPVLFNINELIMFGLPVVWNPLYFVPFLITPLALTLTSYLATLTGLVPPVAHAVEWTTPILLSGYVATGSLAGSALQLFNLALGALIYLPFVRLDQRRHRRAMEQQLGALTQLVQDSEATGQPPRLLARQDRLGSLAKMLASELRHALHRGELALYYQPQMNDRGQIVGLEALLRWRRHGGAPLYPPLVIALAEESNQLRALGDFVAERALADLDRLQRACGRQFGLSLNLTARQLDDPHTTEHIGQLMERYQLAPLALGLELTEQAALSVSSGAMERLLALRQRGARIIMDDFGMGHSSMMHLQQESFDAVKLDGSLVRDLLVNERSSQIIASIVQLSQTLGFRVVAEYVETAPQRDRLLELGCRYYQGYLFSPALPPEALIPFIAEHETAHRGKG